MNGTEVDGLAKIASSQSQPNLYAIGVGFLVFCGTGFGWMGGLLGLVFWLTGWLVGCLIWYIIR